MIRGLLKSIEGQFAPCRQNLTKERLKWPARASFGSVRCYALANPKIQPFLQPAVPPKVFNQMDKKKTSYYPKQASARSE